MDVVESSRFLFRTAYLCRGHNCQKHGILKSAHLAYPFDVESYFTIDTSHTTNSQTSLIIL